MRQIIPRPFDGGKLASACEWFGRNARGDRDLPDNQSADSALVPVAFSTAFIGFSRM